MMESSDELWHKRRRDPGHRRPGLGTVNRIRRKESRARAYRRDSAGGCVCVSLWRFSDWCSFSTGEGYVGCTVGVRMGKEVWGKWTSKMNRLGESGRADLCGPVSPSAQNRLSLCV